MPMPKKSPEQHIRDGTYRRDRHAQRVLPDLGELPPAPSWLSAAARKEWKRLAKHGTFQFVLTALDGDILAEYLVLRDRLIEDAKGGKRMTATERQSLNQLRDRLGLSPGARRNKVDFPSSIRNENKFAALRRQREIEAMTE